MALWNFISIMALIVVYVASSMAEPRGNPVETYGGTSAENCSFPFLYNGVAQFTCVPHSSRLHCGTYYFRDFWDEWAFCKYPNCISTTIGKEYFGTKATANGKTCQRWDSQSPHTHSFELINFPGADTWDDVSNYCRNPDDSSDGPWCFTTDPNTRVGSCDIPTCEDECLGTLLNDLDDAALTASSTFTEPGITHSTANSRLDFFPSAGEAGGWCAGTDSGEWIEALFASTHRIMGVILKPTSDGEYWVGEYELHYSTQGTAGNFTQVMNTTSGTPQIFQGNFDPQYPAAFLLEQPIYAKRVRIYPTSFVNRTCLRWDLVGCQDTDHCASGPCLQGGTCRDLVGGFACECNANYTGTICNEVFDFCVSSPCKNHATCVPVVGGFECQCQSGFTSDLCELSEHESCLSLALANITTSGVYNIPFYKSIGHSDCQMKLQYEGYVNHITTNRIYTGTSDTKQECLTRCLGMADCFAASWTQLSSTCHLDKAGEVNIHSGDPHIKLDGYYRKICYEEYKDVHCDFSFPGTPVTIINHNHMENRTTLHRSGSLAFGYGISYAPFHWDDLAELKYHSALCSQSVSWYCKSSDADNNGLRFFNGDAPALQSSYFGDDTCECILRDACLAGGSDCRCYSAWDWDSDGDTYMEKDLLPIKETLHGDTDSSYEFVTVQISALTCVQSTVPTDECLSNPCQNGGNCTDGYFEYTCACVAGYTGASCQSDINECDSGPCQHGGLCLDQIDGYQCSCQDGYAGIHCETDINECASDPCFNRASCVDLQDRWRCICRPGFAGSTCDIEIDECDSDPCLQGGTCMDLLNSYNCTCPPGYSGARCEIDIDECASDPCQNGGSCINLIAEYSCSCTQGFSGLSCEIDDDECLSNPCQHNGTCDNQPGMFKCACPRGFLGVSCEINVDECSSQPCLNNGLCVDGANGFVCDCEAGYRGTYCEIEINECQSNPCQNRAPCRDGTGSYTCQCRTGFTGVNCEQDINECLNNPCKNGGTCENFVGGFNCKCRPGLAGSTCELLSVNGQWSGWGAWGPCPVQCGQGVKTRQRQCNNPSPANGGDHCAGEQSEFDVCYSAECADIDGRWSRWSEWSRCSATCGQGTKTRTRDCNNPPVKGDGKPCAGPESSTLSCKDRECGDPVDGRWSLWGSWSNCSATCGLDVVTRIRTCSDPPAVFGGKPCEGIDNQQVPCTSPNCLAGTSEECEEWSEWSKCEPSCGSGKRKRERTCYELVTNGVSGTGTTLSAPAKVENLEYEHEHCEERPCTTFQCMECTGEYTEGDDSSKLSCRGPRRTCPEDKPYCVHTFTKQGATTITKKGCESYSVCNINMSDTCQTLRIEAIDNMRMYKSNINGPLQPHADTVKQVFENSGEDIECVICCKSSMCNIGILPPSMFIMSTASNLFSNILLVFGFVFLQIMFKQNLR